MCARHLTLLLAAFFTLHLKANVQADTTYLADVKTIIDSAETGFAYLHDFKFKKAERIKNYLEKQYPHNYLTSFYNANFHWWKIVTGYNSDAEREKFQKNLLTLEKEYDKVDEKELGNRQFYTLINTHAYKSRLHVLNKDYVKALMEVNRSISKIKLSFGKEKNYNWFYLTSGIYNYHIEHAKKEHPLMLPYFITLPKGGKEKGIQQLKMAINSGNKILSTEGKYFLMRIYLDKEKNYENARKLCSRLVKEHPGNLLFRYYGFLNELYDGQEKQAIELLEKLLAEGKRNKEITEKQLNHFTELTKEDLKNYYLNSEE